MAWSVFSPALLRYELRDKEIDPNTSALLEAIAKQLRYFNNVGIHKSSEFTETGQQPAYLAAFTIEVPLNKQASDAFGYQLCYDMVKDTRAPSAEARYRV
jgi:hypothetical protein